MPIAEDIFSIGVNTGNSLDAADVVLTKFGTNESIQDLDYVSVPMPTELANDLRVARKAIVEAKGDMKKAGAIYANLAAKSKRRNIDDLINSYTLYIAEAVNKLISRTDLSIDLIGFHGQTCAHQPPSIAKSPNRAYTVQIGDGQLLANETGIPVVFDFRSDDLMNGGEAAPIAPIHHQHLAYHLKNSGKFPVAFCNAGNTGNISVISQLPDGNIVTLGWDTGPFNAYPDKLMQEIKNQSCDKNGYVGLTGKVNIDLLAQLFSKGALTQTGENFFLKAPPKSSDPQWYDMLRTIVNKVTINNNLISFEDKVRTAEYFAAYTLFYSLRWIPAQLDMPKNFVLCGGGWNNPVARLHFEQLIRGNFSETPILTEHKQLFVDISERLRKNGAPELELADTFGFSSQFMEARIFADAAVCRVKGIPFTFPQTTGCRTPTVLGIIRFPQSGAAGEKMKHLMNKYNSADMTQDLQTFSGRWSRAAGDWSHG